MEVWSPLRDNLIIWHFSAHESLYIKMRKALAWSRCISDEMPAALWEGHFLLEDKKSGLERRTKRRCRNWVIKVLLERASSYGAATLYLDLDPITRVCSGHIHISFLSRTTMICWCKWFVLISGNLFTRLCSPELKTSLGSPQNEALALGNFPSSLQLVMAEKTN